MLLNELLKAIQPVEVAGDSNIEITGVNIDSRLIYLLPSQKEQSPSFARICRKNL